MSKAITSFIATQKPTTPCVIIDTNMIAQNYRQLNTLLPQADIFYAVKANPGVPIIETLIQLGGHFDVASIEELDLVLSCGAKPDNISFGNTIKKERHIAYAYQKGIRLFAYDSIEELQKISRAAPGSKAFCRILWMCEGADWPLSRKFGCEAEMAVNLIIESKKLGLIPYGISFHPGSQQKDIRQWELAITKIAALFAEIKEKSGITLQMINLGGGFPTRYRDAIEPIENYVSVIQKALTKNFGQKQPRIIIEPGRSMVGNAGIICTEIVLISKKSSAPNEPRWIYLDIGRFSGLEETMGEAIKYQFTSDRDGSNTGPVIIAGPTCDSADILYEKTKYQFPLNLQIGDVLTIHGAGAYTTSYAAVNFNGFLPPTIYFVSEKTINKSQLKEKTAHELS